jgi:hypothetical protein
MLIYNIENYVAPHQAPLPGSPKGSLSADTELLEFVALLVIRNGYGSFAGAVRPLIAQSSPGPWLTLPRPIRSQL